MPNKKEELVETVETEGKTPVSEENKENKEKLTREELLAQREAAKGAIKEERKKIDAKNAYLTKLNAFIKKKQIFQAKITGTSSIIVEGTKYITATGTIIFDEYPVSLDIPFEEMYTIDNVLDMSTVDLTTSTGRKEYETRKEKMLIKFRGATVPVVITQLVADPNNPEITQILCSRKEAAETLKKANFIDKTTCKVGDMRIADIVSVSDHTVVASYCGVDMVIQQYNLTYRYLSNLTSFYKPGMQLKFLIKDLVVNGNDVTITPNTKYMEILRTAQRLQMDTIVRPGNKIGVVITTVAKKGGIPNILCCWSVDYEIPVFVEISRRIAIETNPKSGDEIIVTIDNIDRATGKITAIYYRHTNEQGLFDSYFKI